MALTFSQARTIIQHNLGDSSNSTFVDQCLNEAQREVARSRPWPELVSRAFVLTSAAYDTGTIAVANAGTTWTLTGGTFPTDVASGAYWIGLSLSGPKYKIITRTDGTHVETTGSAFQEDTVTASSYIVWKSHVSLASTVDRVEEMWLHRGGGTVLLTNAATDNQLTDWLHYPSGKGVPCRFLMIERDSSGNRQFLLGPETPDDVYRIEVVSRRKTVDDTFSGNLDESRWPVIVARALSMAYERDYPERAEKALLRYRHLLSEEWAAEEEVETQSVSVGANRFYYPRGGRWQEGILGLGTVQDPS